MLVSTKNTTYRKTDFGVIEDVNKKLVLTDGTFFNRYTVEYPMIEYENPSLNSEDPETPLPLNSFVKKIRVSTVQNGKKTYFSEDDGKMVEEDDICNMVVYYEDNMGRNHRVIPNDVYKFLLKRPNLIVSPEGMLVFYTDKAIFATFDCFHYYWVNDWTIKINEDTTIDSIYINEEGALMVALNTQEPFSFWNDELHCECVLQEDTVAVYSLKFELDFTDRIPIKPIATRIE